jgi:hypothetical protein
MSAMFSVLKLQNHVLYLFLPQAYAAKPWSYAYVIHIFTDFMHFLYGPRQMPHKNVIFSLMLGCRIYVSPNVMRHFPSPDYRIYLILHFIVFFSELLSVVARHT